MTESSRHGLLAAGNFIIDHVKIIDAYPAPEMLATILDQSSSNGGGPYNVLKDLVKLQAPFPLEALGLTGNDDHGRWILKDCQDCGIKTDLLQQTEEAATSYTDAMTVREGGQRTFFHHRGANAVLTPAHFKLTESRAKIFHLAYLLLLDQLDHVDAAGRAGASYVLENASSLGFLTSADFVSAHHPDITRIAESSLPYIDYLFINEIETGMVLQMDLRPGGIPDWKAAEIAARKLLDLGVRRLVTLHFQDGALALSSDGSCWRQASVQYPASELRGSTGAGDAFAAGMLMGLHENWPIPDCLELAVCSAASSLADSTPSEAVLPFRQCLDLGKRHGYRSF